LLDQGLGQLSAAALGGRAAACQVLAGWLKKVAPVAPDGPASPSMQRHRITVAARQIVCLRQPLQLLVSQLSPLAWDSKLAPGVDSSSPGGQDSGVPAAEAVAAVAASVAEVELVEVGGAAGLAAEVAELGVLAPGKEAVQAAAVVAAVAADLHL